jgi:hypothetical protein
MSKDPGVDIFAALLEPSFFEEFVTAINDARDGYFRRVAKETDEGDADEADEDHLRYDFQDPLARIRCDLSDDLATVWHQQAERLVQQYAPLPPVTAEDLTSLLIPQLAGDPLAPEVSDEVLLKLLRAGLLMDKLFEPDRIERLRGHEEVRSVADAYEILENDPEGYDTFPPHWFRDRVLKEFKTTAPDFLLKKWDVIDEDEAARLKKESERRAEESKATSEWLQSNFADFYRTGPKPPRKSGKTYPEPPRKDDQLAMQDIHPACWGEMYDNTFWESGSGAEILFLLVPDEKVNYNAGERDCVVKVMLDGDFTRSALNKAVERMRPAVKFMVYLAGIAAEVRKEPRLWRLYTPGIREFFRTGIGLLLLDENGHDRDELTQRLQNALYLLRIEKDVTNHRLGLSLCFGAIESLLTTEDRKKSTSDELKEYTVALLQPTPSARKGAKTAISRLYDRRSEMLHGRWVASKLEDASLRQKVRTLAVGVLIGVIQARACWTRTGEDLALSGKGKGLHWELHVCHETDARMVGVEDLSAYLPSNIPKTKTK